MFQTFTPREYLQIDIASNFGLDKDDWDVRLDWFRENENRLEELNSKAEEPALYFAGVKAYRQVQSGQPIGYMISLDATASGLQLLACLAGDRSAASICNVIDNGRRMDAYTSVYEEMCSRIGDNAKIDRKETKSALMKALYSSTAAPKEAFGEGILLNTFYSSVTDLLPGAWELNQAFLNLWDNKAYSHDWCLPDNFHVHVKVMETVTERAHFLNRPIDIPVKVNRPMDEGRSLNANTIHSIDGMVVREMTRRCMYNPQQVEAVREALATGCGTRAETEKDHMLITLWEHFKMSGYLSARILDYIDSDNVGLINRQEILKLINSLPAKPFQLLSIHDCFRCLPTYGNDLRWQYNNQLYMIAKSNLLGFLVGQLIGSPIRTAKLDPDLHESIMETNYALS